MLVASPTRQAGIVSRPDEAVSNHDSIDYHMRHDMFTYPSAHLVTYCTGMFTVVRPKDRT